MSTETALLRVFNDVLYAIDDHQEVVLVLLDLSSAFDTIDHTLLLERLSHRYGINGTVLEWFKSYLLDRTQSVKVKDALSNDKKLLFGIPQRSVLGPIFFSLFFAPMEDVITAHGLSCMIYADDSQPYVILDPKKNRDAMLSKIELCIKDILTWCAKNGLTCDPDKTKVLHLTSRFTKDYEVPLKINVNDNIISSSPNARDLGVTVDSHLKMTTHAYREIHLLQQCCP
ncbi:Hypothetical predicted protein [Paramuricea clavata]|uniref:Uncharacterized protein n=1 Tax=Paramuricea clavata TaxID=317549 RepID=A0A7D9DV34_PARCT|nr:Hypothetical predicted protein [Paramuricea clavata]